MWLAGTIMLSLWIQERSQDSFDILEKTLLSGGESDERLIPL